MTRYFPRHAHASLRPLPPMSPCQRHKEDLIRKASYRVSVLLLLGGGERQNLFRQQGEATQPTVSISVTVSARHALLSLRVNPGRLLRHGRANPRVHRVKHRPPDSLPSIPFTAFSPLRQRLNTTLPDSRSWSSAPGGILATAPGNIYRGTATEILRQDLRCLEIFTFFLIMISE